MYHETMLKTFADDEELQEARERLAERRRAYWASKDRPAMLVEGAEYSPSTKVLNDKAIHNL